MTDAPDTIAREKAEAEQRGQSLLVAALDACASGQQIASAHLAKEVRDQLIALWKIREEADARVAAALRDAASMFARQAEDMKRDGDPYWEAEQDAKNILALIPDAGAAFDRAIAEAEARGMERAADLHDDTFCDKRANKAYWQSDLIRAEAAAIRARTKKDNTDD